MLEQLIERMKLEGKITQEEIDKQIEDLKAKKPQTEEGLKIKELEVQQNQTNDDLSALMDFIISGGM